MALLCGAIIATTYRYTAGESRSFAITLLFLPAVVSMIILLIGANLARAFSLAGAFSIIRFRSEPGEPRDIALVLFAMASGLAAGVGMPHYGLLITLVLSAVLIGVDRFGFKGQRPPAHLLNITVPEDLDFDALLPKVLETYCNDQRLETVKLTGLGSLYQLKYRVQLKSSDQSKALIDALRVVNGNLAITLSPMPYSRS